jgi:DNA-binding NarL/FixJ family response regulator
VRIVLAEDNVLLREGLMRLLADAGLTVLSGVEDPTALLADVARHRPDVAIVDIRLPPTRTDEGLRARSGVAIPKPGCSCSRSTCG